MEQANGVCSNLKKVLAMKSGTVALVKSHILKPETLENRFIRKGN